MRKGGSGRLRIVAGAKRGRLIGVPRDDGVRPTSEVVREAVFNVLGEIGGLSVLDLFAGSGALGLEALSRGADHCVFVERDPNTVSSLRKNISALGYEGESQVLATDYRTAIRALKREETIFDLLFVDPPYRMLAEVEVELAGSVPALLSSGGVMVVEGPSGHGNDFGLSPVFERSYGDTKVTMVRVGD